MNQMIVANLVHRPIRSLVSVIAIAVEVTLILLMVGLATGLLEDAQSRQRGLGADVVVQPPNARFLTGLSGAPMSIKIGGVLQKLPHVQVVSPIVMQIPPEGALEVIYGIDLKNFEQLGGPFRYLSGGAFQGPWDVLVDDYIASAQHVKVGGPMKLFNHEFRVAGIVQHGRGARKFVPMTTLQDLIGAADKCSVFYLKLDHPDAAKQVVSEIKAVSGLQQYGAYSMSDYLSLFTTGNMPGLSSFINVVIGIAVVIGFLVIFQAMYTAVMERTREIGILKSLGASKAYIVNVILRETLLLAAIGIALGIAISYTARNAIVAKIPTLTIIMARGWLWRATVIAIIGAILGAIYPAFKAAQKDPIDALAYE